jgi:septal ring factor EnvC (AmiA/AmiB activator)
LKTFKEKLSKTKEKKKSLQWDLDRKTREYEKNAASLMDSSKYDELNRKVVGLNEELEQLRVKDTNQHFLTSIGANYRTGKRERKAEG